MESIQASSSNLPDDYLGQPLESLQAQLER